MHHLHLDAKKAIALTSFAAWNALMRADPIFGRYALSDTGRSTFLAAFTVVEGGEWRVAGRLHRIGTPGIPDSGGPARICTDGSEEWFEHGLRHRIGGPAISRPDGTRAWYAHGDLHRIGGPAYIYADGGEVWFEHGVCIERR